MIKMEAFDAYKLYMSLKKHFTTDYDYFKYNKKMRLSQDSFLKRRDKIFFAKLGNRKDKYLEEFLVSNFIQDTNIWVGELLSDSSEERYKEWKKRQESLSYIFKNEMSFIEGWNGEKFNDWFGIEHGDHPNIIRKYLRKEISLETLVLLDLIINFTKKYDKEVTDPVYQEVSKLCKKYQPFLKADKPKLKKMLREMIEA